MKSALWNEGPVCPKGHDKKQTRQTVIALHICHVTVRRMFSDDPGKSRQAPGAPFGGAPFLPPRLPGLGMGY